MRNVTKMLIIILLTLSLLGSVSALAEGDARLPADGLHASIQQTVESLEWVKALPAAQDENVNQLFIVAGYGMDSTAASISLHQRDENGQ